MSAQRRIHIWADSAYLLASGRCRHGGPGAFPDAWNGAVAITGMGVPPWHYWLLELAGIEKPRKLLSLRGFLLVAGAGFEPTTFRL